MNAPRLIAERLKWRNRRSRIKPYQTVAASVVLIGLLAILIAARGDLADSLLWLRSHGPSCAGFAAFFTAVAVAQRRASQRRQFPRSWLAAVPVKPAMARGEAFLIEALPAAVALAALCLLALLATLSMAIGQHGEAKTILALLAFFAGGVALGVGLSFLIPQSKPVVLPPGSRYVPKTKANRAAPIQASLAALGRWPIRQMFAWAQPKVVARATIAVLIMMPLGTMADTAMIVIGVFGVLFAMSLLCSAVLSVSCAARQWLAPLPVRAAAVIGAYLLPVWGAIMAAAAIGALLLSVFNLSYRVSASVSVMAAVIGCATTGAVLLWNTRPRCMP
jgi:hypothetical protein